MRGTIAEQLRALSTALKTSTESLATDPVLASGHGRILDAGDAPTEVVEDLERRVAAAGL